MATAIYLITPIYLVGDWWVMGGDRHVARIATLTSTRNQATVVTYCYMPT